MATLHEASANWWTRSDDERFVSLHDLHAHCSKIREVSAARKVDLAKLKAIPAREMFADATGKDMILVSDKGIPARMNNNAYNQLGLRATFPSGYISSLPADLAALNINHALQNYDGGENSALLLSRLADDALTVRSVTSDTYGRIWNSQITGACVDYFGDGISGYWRVPGEFGKAVKVTKANTTFFSGEQDVFIFLADEEHKIEVKNRRNGETGLLSRGFFISNSETFNGVLMIKTFYFDYVCSNRIVWGAEEVKTLKIRHSKYANERWLDDVVPMLSDYSNAAASTIEDKIALAQSAKVDDVATFIKTKLPATSPHKTAKFANAVMSAHEVAEGRPIETLWDISTGITEHAKEYVNQNERVTIEGYAGKFLELAA